MRKLEQKIHLFQAWYTMLFFDVMHLIGVGTVDFKTLRSHSAGIYRILKRTYIKADAMRALGKLESDEILDVLKKILIQMEKKQNQIIK